MLKASGNEDEDDDVGGDDVGGESNKAPASASESAQSVSASMSDAGSERYGECGGYGFSLL